MRDNNENKLYLAIQNAGLRLTPQRTAICFVLANSEDHPTAQEIFEILRPNYPGMSLATIYNTLDALTRVGAINALGGVGDGIVHYDADTSPHINLACLNCHNVIDYPSEHIEHVEAEVQASSGYRLLGARVLYYGLCPNCQDNKLISPNIPE